MRPIPKAAMPVVEVLRRDVPKPVDLPRETTPAAGTMVLRWGNNISQMCPMGLHPGSNHPRPDYSMDFADGACSERAVYSFWRWWDSLKAADAREAVDAIWGK